MDPTAETNLQLFDRQADALESCVQELLIGGHRRQCGTSHTLRTTGIILAAETAGLRVFLGKQDGGDLRRNHIEGENGLLATLADMQRHGACVVTPSEVRFPGGGTLRWGGLGRESERRRILESRVDVVLLDDLDEIPQALYIRLRDQAMHGVGVTRRVIGACNRLGRAGWVDEHWNGDQEPGRGLILFAPADIAPDLITIPDQPSYRDFIQRIHGARWVWAPHVELIVDAVNRWIWGEWDHLAVYLPSQHGKELTLDTSIRTPSGWTTMGDLRVGDEIFSVNGTPTQVTFKTNAVEKTVYEVSSDDGWTVECSGTHEWVVALDKRTGWKRKTTEYLHNRSPARPSRPASRLHIHGAVQTSVLYKLLPVDPWVLGYWLGDGNSASGRITVGDRDLDFVLRRFAEHYSTKIRRGNGSRAPSLGTTGLYAQLRAVGVLGNKYIPEVYMNAHPGQRLELLRGLIDSDGYVAKDGQIEYCGVNERLIRGVRELIVGLGMKASWVEGRATLNGRDCGAKYRVLFYGTGVASLPRKARRLKKKVQKVHRYLSVKKTKKKRLMQCIQVDHPSHQYLCGQGLLPTHNTEILPRNAIPFIASLFPGDWCAIASYGSSLANSRSADARDNFILAGGVLKEGRGRVNEWLTTQGGGCWSAGTTAGQSGRSGTWIFLDDGDQDWYDAINATKQIKKRRYYGSVLRARESMFAGEMRPQKLAISSTRWDPGDLSGHAMSLGLTAGENWGILVLPALYDPGVQEAYREMYPSFTILPDFRTEPGEPIWEERRSRREWEQRRKMLGPLIFLTECQQNAQGVEQGGKFWAEWFTRLERDPAFATQEPNEGIYVECCRAWDLAGTAGGGDYTAGSKLGRLKDGRVIVRHAVRGQLGPVAVEMLIAATMILDGPTVTIRIPIDPAYGGVAAATSIVNYLRKVAGIVGMKMPPVVPVRPRRVAHATLSAKAARARDLESFAQPADWKAGAGFRIPGGVSFVGVPWSPAVSDQIPDYAEIAKDWPELTTVAAHGNDCGGDWWTPWLREFESFTGQDGRTDDQVDATVDAFDQIRYHEKPRSSVITRP